MRKEEELTAKAGTNRLAQGTIKICG